MTIEDAKKLNNGDIVEYNGRRYKVLHTKERRSADTNEIYISVKCGSKNSTWWIPNKFVEEVK